MEPDDLEDQLARQMPSLVGPVQILSSEKRSGGTLHHVSVGRLVPIDDDGADVRDVGIAVPVVGQIEVDENGRVVHVSADDVDPNAAREARAFTRTLIANGSVRGVPQPTRARRGPTRETHEVFIDRFGRKMIRRMGFDVAGSRRSLR